MGDIINIEAAQVWTVRLTVRVARCENYRVVSGYKGRAARSAMKPP